MRARILTLLTAAISCGDPVGPVPGAPAFAVLVGESLTAPVRTALNIVVKVTDSSGVAVPGQLVNFVVTKGYGQVFAGAALTNAVGEVREIWTLGFAVGEQVIEARAVDQTTGTALTLGRIIATAVPGPEVSPARLLHRDLLVLTSEPGLISDIITPALDADGNHRAFTGITFSGPGLTVAGDTVRSAVEGTWQVRFTAPAFDETVTIRTVEDFKASAWRMTWRCAGGMGTMDSIHGSMTTTQVLGTIARANQVSRGLKLTFGGARVTWSNGNPIGLTSPASEVLDMTQAPDSVIVDSLNVVIRRIADGHFEAAAGRCPAWPVNGKMTLSRVAP